MTGEPFNQWLATHRFRPLKMTATRLLADKRGGFRLRPADVTAPGASSIYSTVNDMARWALNFDSARVGGPRVLQQIHERVWRLRFVRLVRGAAGDTSLL